MSIVKTDHAQAVKLPLAILFTLHILLGASLQAQDFETSSTLSASNILPPELLSSDLHQVAETVPNDGYVNTYTIHSDFGDFSAYGSSLLKVRVQEIKALDELSRVKKSSIYAAAATNAVIAPIKAVGAFAAAPVDTVKGLPAGVGRMFRSLGRTAKSVTKSVTKPSDDEAGEANEEQQTKQGKTEAYAKKFMGVNSSQRKWAAKLAVDPYSSNQVLQKELGEVASVDAAASFGAKLVMPGMGGVGVVASASDLVWQVSPEELRAQNLKSLQQQGASQDQIDVFLDNSVYSPTLQTLIIAALLKMDGVEDREVALEKAVVADSEGLAVFYANTVRMLAAFHVSHRRLSSLTGEGPVVGGLTEDNRLVYSVPIDHLVWTQEFADLVEGRLSDVATSANGRKREFWLLGTATPRAVEELGKRGWTVHQNVRLP